MKAQELRYAQERVKNIFRHRKDKLEEEHRQTGWTEAQYIEALERGRYRINGSPSTSPRGPYGEPNWWRLVVFPDQPKGDAAPLAQALKALGAERDRVLDELVLGDEAKALELLKGFMADA